MRASDRLACARRPCQAVGRRGDRRLVICGLTLCAQEIPMKHIVNESRFAGTGNAGHAREHAERQINIDVFEVMLPRTGDLDG